MKAKLLAGGIILALVTSVTAQDSYEKIIESMLKSMTQTIDVLKSVKDKESADKAKPQIREIGKSMAELKTRADKLGKPSPDQEKVLKEKYEPKLKEVMGQFFTEAKRLSTVDGGLEVLKELEAFKMGKAGPKKDKN